MATRPCAICRSRFEVDPRVGKRHRICDRETCRAERNKQACARWRRIHPDEVKDSRLRRNLPKHPPDPSAVVVLDPMRHFRMEVVRHEIGGRTAVVLEEVAKVLVCIARHEMPPKVKVRGRKSCKDLAPTARHERPTDGPRPGAPIGREDAHP